MKNQRTNLRGRHRVCRYPISTASSLLQTVIANTRFVPCDGCFLDPSIYSLREKLVLRFCEKLCVNILLDVVKCDSLGFNLLDELDVVISVLCLDSGTYIAYILEFESCFGKAIDILILDCLAYEISLSLVRLVLHAVVIIVHLDEFIE